MKFVALLVVALAVYAELLNPSQFSVEETFPGETNQFSYSDKSYVRVQYSSVEPVRFMIRAYAKGKEIEESYRLSPQVLYPKGEGEAIAWISFIKDVSVDQVSVEYLDSDWQVLSRKTISVKWSWVEKLLKSEKTKVPEWVSKLNFLQQQMIRSQLDQKNNHETFFESILVDVLYFLFAIYLLAQYYAFSVARGSWRKRTLLPIFLFIPAILYALDSYANQSSHWPLMLLAVAPISLVYLGVIYVWHKASASK